jgi:hypothetical protein
MHPPRSLTSIRSDGGATGWNPVVTQDGDARRTPDGGVGRGACSGVRNPTSCTLPAPPHALPILSTCGARSTMKRGLPVPASAMEQAKAGPDFGDCHACKRAPPLT